ncbi:hypothetical protein HDU85_005185 [Gaertneriomyces sp. JEL0708]|nr:hypothetical protein HDU85_005185 [Gaertneriomyces sp. JEL0708]
MAITTAFDKSVKIWNMSTEEPFITDTYDIEDLGRDRPWCLAYMTHYATIALGVTQITKASVRASLRLLQVTESGIRESANLAGHRTSIYALQALSSHTFSSASYDGTARLWDVRTGSAVAVLEDPDDYPVFSLASDAGERYLVTGTARYGVVRAYSLAYLRQSSRGTAPVKTMFMAPRTRASVYSLTMDHSRITAGLDNQVSMLYIPSGSDNRAG